MDKFPLLWAGRPTGELTARQEALYTCFSARCALPEPGLWCAWAVGEGGELRLGVLEPDGAEAVIQRRFSRRMTEPLGRLVRGERPRGDRPGRTPPRRRSCSGAPGSGGSSRGAGEYWRGGGGASFSWRSPGRRAGPFP